jgi:hypothetical protein
MVGVRLGDGLCGCYIIPKKSRLDIPVLFLTYGVSIHTLSNLNSGSDNSSAGCGIWVAIAGLFFF